MKMTFFSSDKIYYNFSQENPKTVWQNPLLFYLIWIPAKSSKYIYTCNIILNNNIPLPDQPKPSPLLFTLSNTRWFYSSMESPWLGKGSSEATNLISCLALVKCTLRNIYKIKNCLLISSQNIVYTVQQFQHVKKLLKLLWNIACDKNGRIAKMLVRMTNWLQYIYTVYYSWEFIHMFKLLHNWHCPI